jgi:hypothetical protein
VAALCTSTPGLMLLWQALVPLAPLVLVIAPGLWRNVCPLATLNGLPGRLGWTRGRRLPARAQRVAPALSAGLFCAVLPLRGVALDQSGLALAAFMLLLLAVAFLSGVLHGGKGGWCSHFCPMGPVERLYGHSPLLVVHDTHCRPCVGCVRHCYDLHPTGALLAEVYGGDQRLRLARLAFAGAMPWLCVAFFTQPALAHPALGALLLLYGRLALLAAIGAGLGLALAWCPWLTPQQVIRAHTVAALNLYCLFALHAAPLPAPRAAGVALLSGLWLWVAVRRECVFLAQRILGAVGRRRGAPATEAASA